MKKGLTMVTKNVAIYVVFDDILKSMNYKETKKRKTTNAEIMSVALIAAGYFGRNIGESLCFVRSTDLMLHMLNKNCFNCSFNQIVELFSELFFYIGRAIKGLNLDSIYIINSFPVSVYQNIRIANFHILKGEQNRVYCRSKCCYFYVSKVHMIVTSNDVPLKFTFITGRLHDIDGIKQMSINLPQASELLTDSAYTAYLLKEILADKHIYLLATRKANSKYPHDPCLEHLISISRERTETAISDITKKIPKKIHAVTQAVFLIKLIAFICIYAFDILRDYK